MYSILPTHRTQKCGKAGEAAAGPAFNDGNINMKVYKRNYFINMLFVDGIEW